MLNAVDIPIGCVFSYNGDRSSFCLRTNKNSAVYLNGGAIVDIVYFSGWDGHCINHGPIRSIEVETLKKKERVVVEEVRVVETIVLRKKFEL